MAPRDVNAQRVPAMAAAQMVDGSAISLQMLQDLFLFYAHQRDTKVVKGLTDTLYTVRDKSRYGNAPPSRRPAEVLPAAWGMLCA